MLELIFFYILQNIIQGYNSHFLCARVTVFSGVHQKNFAGAGLLCTGMTFDLKNAPAKFMMHNHASSSPADGGGNGGGYGNNHCKVTTVTMTMTTMADANAEADAPRQLQQQQQQLPQQQRRNSKRWGVSTSKDVRSAGVGCIGRKQRPGNGGNNNHGGIVPAKGKCGGYPGGVALPPLPPPFPPTR